MAMSGGGGGGDIYTDYSSAYYVYYAGQAVGDTDFVATIATHSAGSAVLTYNAPSSGDEGWLSYNDGTNQLGLLVLHNTTRGNSGYVLDAILATNTIILRDVAPADWAVGDTITLRSQVCNTGGTPYFFDLYVGGFVPSAATILYLGRYLKSSAANNNMRVHPFESYGAAKAIGTVTLVANIPHYWFTPVAINSQKICIAGDASGAGTITTFAFKCQGYELPA